MYGERIQKWTAEYHAVNTEGEAVQLWFGIDMGGATWKSTTAKDKVEKTPQGLIC